MASYPFFQIDAFAEGPLSGGPAAIIPMEAFPDAALMQAIAAENNLAETAFLVGASEGVWSLRWFTPLLEVPLCGHATLAAAHALYAHLGYQGERIGFDTASGRLSVARLSDGRLEMDFPARRPVRIDPPAGLSEALGAVPSEVWAAQYLLALFEEPATIRGLNPDSDGIKAIAGRATQGRGNLVCAAPGPPGYDVISRFFAPGSGIVEDPATGSAHCIIAPLFSDRLGKPELVCYQAYPGRGAKITTRIETDRVMLSGRARTVIEGRFHL